MTPRGLWTPGLDGRTGGVKVEFGKWRGSLSWGMGRKEVADGASPKQMHHRIAQSHAKSPGSSFRKQVSNKRGLETASICKHWAGRESPLDCLRCRRSTSPGQPRAGGALGLRFVVGALNERDLALPHLPT